MMLYAKTNPKDLIQDLISEFLSIKGLLKNSIYLEYKIETQSYLTLSDFNILDSSSKECKLVALFLINNLGQRYIEFKILLKKVVFQDTQAAMQQTLKPFFELNLDFSKFLITLMPFLIQIYKKYRLQLGSNLSQFGRLDGKDGSVECCKHDKVVLLP